MPFVHGSKTRVMLDGIDLSPFLTAADLTLDVDAADTTTFRAAWKSAIAGTIASRGDFSGLYDPTQLTVRDLIGDDVSLTGGVLSVSPDGADVIGQPARLLLIISSSYIESSPVGGVIGMRWSVLSAQVQGIGLVLHPLAEDTNTTTGADRDDGAATTTGWTAHLHVTAVDAGSWVVKLQDAATTDWTDVSGGSFTAKTGAGSQRLVGAAGATLRRHVRYVATRTGGSAGDGITFMLAYSRN